MRLDTIAKKIVRIPRAARYFRSLASRDTSGINGYERKWSSQNGEDGLLQELFRRLRPQTTFTVEFGVETGEECNSAHLLRSCGWSGLLLEGDPALAARLAANYATFPNVMTAQAMIGPENIEDIFKEHGVPEDLALLSIDIDGNDYYVWRAVTSYSPLVVVIEYNPFYPPPARWVIAYNPAHRWDKTVYYGASLSSLHALGAQKGYVLAATDSRGVNAFFVRADAAAAAGIEPLTAEVAYHRGSIFNQLPYRSGPSETL